MKHIIAFFCLALVLASCEGDQGPPGVDGAVGVAFEIERNFNATNEYQITEEYGFNIVPSDVVLVYISWDTFEGKEIWRLVPQTQFFDDGGVLTYNYDFTDVDYSIFLEANFPLNQLDSIWTDNQYFRVVIVPADSISGVDTSNIDEVIQASKIENIKSLESIEY